MSDTLPLIPAGDRLAKVIARAGLCSRRDAELWIKDGRVAVNGKVVKTPAFNVSDKDRIKVDGEPLAERQGTRVWLYHKPPGLVVTEKDPEGRPTIFETLEEHGLPRVVTIGRLDINTEGLLLLTNDGGLKRVLELPATGWLRRYRVRAFGTVTQPQLDQLKDGIEIDGIKYGPIEAVLERDQGSNVWLVVALREGKNREVKNVLAHLGLAVNRLIRISFGPFQLGDIAVGAVETVRARVLREQLGKRLADEAEVDFDSDMPEVAAAVADTRRRVTNPKLRAAPPNKAQPRQRKAVEEAQFRFTDRDDGPRDVSDRPRKDRPGGRTETRRAAPVKPEAPLRTIRHDDGSTSQFRPHVPRKPREDGDDKPFAKGGERPTRSFDDRPKRDFGDKPKRDFGDKPRGPRPAGDRPARSFGDKPRGDFADRPKRDYGDKPRGPRPAGDRPARSFGDKPRGDFADRPKRDYGDKPRGPRPDGDRPARPFSKPRGDFADRPRPARDGAAPARSFSDKPRRDHGDKPRGPRPTGDRPARSFGDKPAGDRPSRPGRNYDEKPQRQRTGAGRPPAAGADKPRGPSRGARPGGDGPRGPRPTGAVPRGARPGGDKPRGARPAGDKPRGGPRGGSRPPGKPRS